MSSFVVYADRHDNPGNQSSTLKDNLLASNLLLCGYRSLRTLVHVLVSTYIWEAR